MGSDCKCVQGYCLAWWKHKIVVVVVQYTVNILKNWFYNLIGWNVWYMGYISIKLLLKIQRTRDHNGIK